MLWWHRGIMSRWRYIGIVAARRSAMILQYLLLKARLFFNRTEGASAIEYAIVVAMVAVVVVAFVTPMGDRVLAIFNNILTSLDGTAVVRPTP
jgi:pilus assembly protein Flp/PilA